MLLIYHQKNISSQHMNWITITDESEIQTIFKSEDYAIIYKHSPSCMTSLMAYRQLKAEVQKATEIDIPLYIVDVLKNRKEARAIADAFDVRHESPQILLVKAGACVYDTSHENVSLKAVLKHV